MMSFLICILGMQVDSLAGNVNVNVYDYKTIQGYSLGDAGAFGIFANTYEIAGSIESNFAAQTFIRQGNHTVGTKLNNGVAGNTETYLYVGNFDELTNAGINSEWVGPMNLNAPVSVFSVGEDYAVEKKADGKYYIRVPNHSIENKISDHPIEVLDNSNRTFDVQMVQSLRRLEAVAHNYMQLEATAGTMFDRSSWNQNSEGVNLEDGVNVFHIDVMDLTKYQDRSFVFDNIHRATQVIINVNIPRDYEETVVLRKNMDALSVYSEEVGKILWNFGDFDGTIEIGAMRGTVLAPNARIIGSSSATAGSLIGEYVYTQGTHYKNDFVKGDFEFEIPTFDYKATFAMDKTVNPSILEMDLENPELNTIEINYELSFDPVPADVVQIAKQKEVVLIIDTSGSMEWDIHGDETHQYGKQRMTIAKNAAHLFLDSMAEDENTQVGIVSFSTNASVRSEIKNVADNLQNLKGTINQLRSGGGTNIGDGLRLAKSMLNNGNDAEKYVVFLGDGKPTGFSYERYYTDWQSPRVNLLVNNRRWERMRLSDVDYYYGADETEKTLVNSGQLDYGNYASDYARVMSGALDTQQIKGYYIGFTKDADVEGLILDSDTKNSSFHYAETANDLEKIYQEIANEIKSSVYLQDIIFEETLPHGLKIKTINYLSDEPKLSRISEDKKEIHAEFGNRIYVLNDEQTAYVADPIRFSMIVDVASTGDYIIGANNSSAFHYIDFDTSPGHQYFDEIAFKAVMKNTDNVLTIDTHLDAPTNLVEADNDGVYIRATSQYFDIAGVYATYSTSDDINAKDYERDQATGNSWPAINPATPDNVYNATEADPDNNPDTPAPADVVIGQIPVNKTGYYTVYAVDIYGNYTIQTVYIIVKIDLPDII